MRILRKGGVLFVLAGMLTLMFLTFACATTEIFTFSGDECGSNLIGLVNKTINTQQDSLICVTPAQTIFGSYAGLVAEYDGGEHILMDNRNYDCLGSVKTRSGCCFTPTNPVVKFTRTLRDCRTTLFEISGQVSYAPEPPLNCLAVLDPVCCLIGDDETTKSECQCTSDGGTKLYDGECETCIPNCPIGAECGDDGCGGTCGTCSGTEACNSTGQCNECPQYIPPGGGFCPGGVTIPGEIDPVTGCSGVPGCVNNSIILRLSSATNAHGEIARLNNYGIIVNYTEIFGEMYLGVNAHVCNGRNRVLRLSSETNAHAYGPNDAAPADAVEICYGNLSCGIRQTSCDLDEERVVALSARTNAHLEAIGSNNYSYFVCCKPGGTVFESNYSWKNEAGDRINSARERDKVRGIAKTGLGGNVLVNFSIYEKDSAFDDVIREGLEVRTGADGIARINWTITREDLDAAHVGSLLEGKIGEFYFIVGYSNGTTEAGGTSGILDISLKNTTEQCISTFIDPVDNEERLITYCDDYNFIDGASNATKEVQCNYDCNDAKENEKILITGPITNYRCKWVNNSGCKFTFNWSSCIPQCSGKECGDADGCGGECIVHAGCEDDEVCSRGECVPESGDDDGGSSGESGFPPGNCVSVPINDECKNGYRHVDYIYKKNFQGKLWTEEEWKWNTGFDCPAGTSLDVPCQTAVQEVLPFFSVFNMVAAMAVIALVYVVVLFRREFG